MELTGKQRAQLRAMANELEPIVHIGKDGIGENLVKQANDALEARELIKCRVLDNSTRWRGVFLTTKIRCTYAHAHRTSAVGSPCGLPVPRKPHGKPLRRGHEKRQPHSCNCLIFIGGNKRI